jgi:hypothetical protein
MKRDILCAATAFLVGGLVTAGTVRFVARAFAVDVPLWLSVLVGVTVYTVVWAAGRRLTRPSTDTPRRAVPATLSRWVEPTGEWIDSTGSSTDDWADSTPGDSTDGWNDPTGSADTGSWLDGDVDPEAVWAGPATQPEAALAEQAARLIVDSQFGSASMLQRRLRIGFLRAESLLDHLEEAGIVGPRRDGPRDVLISHGRLDAALRTLARRSR